MGFVMLRIGYLQWSQRIGVGLIGGIQQNKQVCDKNIGFIEKLAVQN